jgi:pyruvate dehydrogenase E2 component (dihydrolipoamide acetyltransferase)
MPADTAAREFALPDLGEGLEDAVLVEWHVAVGDVVTLNQVLCTVETAKATVDLPSPFAGRVVERFGEPGETVPVGALLVRVAADGEDDDDQAAEAAEAAEADEAADAPASTRRATLVGYGPDEGPSRRHRRRAPSPAADAAPRAAPDRAGRDVLAKPPVRKLARELGVDLASVAPGTGPDGVITRDDVSRAASSEPAAAARPVAWALPAPVLPGDVIPVTGVRARIAEHMARSRSSIPDASCAVTVDCGRLLEVRAALRDVAKERATVDVLTPFALILRLLVAALRSRPILNATFDDEGQQIRVHESIDLGVGTDTPRGLLVPVVHAAHERTTLELAAEVRRLADGARAGTLTPAELTGSTFTVSNFGMLGIDDGYPVINHPEVAILGVGAIRERAVVVDGQVVARPTAGLTCCFDHRACDGADAAAFLTRLRELIESPETLILET